MFEHATLVVTGAGASVDSTADGIPRSYKARPKHPLWHDAAAAVKVEPPSTKGLIEAIRKDGLGCGTILDQLSDVVLAEVVDRRFVRNIAEVAVW